MVGKGRISVAMASYNGEQYLAKQVDSILQNLGEGDELVVSDDGSTDRTLAILHDYQTRDQRVRVVAGPGQGVKQNIGNAISQCGGEYIFLADQDDVWLPGKVERIMRVFEETGAHLVIHDARVICASEREEELMPSFFAFRNAGPGVGKNIWKNGYIGCCMAFRAELRELALPIPDDIEMHDQWIGVLNDWCYQDTAFLREPLLLYRRHGGNQSQMRHYGIAKMVRNRAVFCLRFLQRIRKFPKF